MALKAFVAGPRSDDGYHGWPIMAIRVVLAASAEAALAAIRKTEPTWDVEERNLLHVQAEEEKA